MSLYAGAVSPRTGIREIAEEAGVSTATVSLALRDKGRMSEETRTRIKALAAARGYIPNAAARSLIGGRTGLIGISIPIAGDVPEVMGEVEYFFRLLGAAAAKSLELGFGLLVSIPGKDPGQIAMDGAIVVDPGLDDPFVAACDRSGLPVVTVGRRVLSETPVPERTWVVDNDYPAATMAMLDHLEERGSSNPALFATRPVDSFQSDSIEAYREWCAAKGKPERIVIAESPHPHDAVAAATDFFTGDGPPDGIYATIDTLARAVMDEASAEDVGIPDRIKLATCSNGEIARSASPQLTTIEEHPDRLGEAAVELLVAAITDPESAPTYVEVDTDLILRDSTS